MYPILYIDAIRIKIRDGGVVANKAAHVVIGVDIDGIKQVLGVWIQQSEGAKFWHGVLTELRNRGCRDALFVCCDGLTGLPESIAAVWPQATIQTSSIHNGWAGTVPAVTRAIPVTAYANALPSRPTRRPAGPGWWRASHRPAGVALRAPR